MTSSVTPIPDILTVRHPHNYINTIKILYAVLRKTTNLALSSSAATSNNNASSLSDDEYILHNTWNETECYKARNLQINLKYSQWQRNIRSSVSTHADSATATAAAADIPLPLRAANIRVGLGEPLR